MYKKDRFASKMALYAWKNEGKNWNDRLIDTYYKQACCIYLQTIEHCTSLF